MWAARLFRTLLIKEAEDPKPGEQHVDSPSKFPL